MKKIPISLAVIAALGLAVATFTVEAAKIKKCKDAEGKWHYGDQAAEECERSKVIELSGQGVKTKVIRAPATEEELAARELEKAEMEAAKKRAAEQAKIDRQLLATYGHEDDIIYIRDRKLVQIDSTIAAATATLKPLRAALARMEKDAAAAKAGSQAAKDLQVQIIKTKQQIARHETAMAAKRQEQEAIRAQAEADLKRYRELKRQSVTDVSGG
ncbi:MAG: hypothetical protein OES46_04735 [Gammaproteobacteria bacterium]|jgi:hypothetical protein|nr:hypothetical protein [Gammaproteobacteria bacterium]